MRVAAVSLGSVHAFSKESVREITLLAGLGVEGDVHAGVTVKHRSRVARDPSQANLRQVHLIHSELLRELEAKGFEVLPGQLGDNITTVGLDLLALPLNSELHLGASAVVRITGLRNPCAQIESFRSGLLESVLERGSDGRLTRKAGVMGIVVEGGVVRAGDRIRVDMPAAPHVPLRPV
jgi:MOSC domain-containing protein YiiM